MTHEGDKKLVEEHGAEGSAGRGEESEDAGRASGLKHHELEYTLFDESTLDGKDGRVPL
jgi:hypothetical protein